MLLNDDWINNEMKAEMKIFFETNENEDTSYQNVWETLKTGSRGKFRAINTHMTAKKDLKLTPYCQN